MPRTTPRQLSAAIRFAALCIVGSNALAQLAPAPWLSVDMPHGGCGLTVRQDGTASIRFGAMPRWVRVAPGTFDFDQLASDLRNKSYPQNTSRSTGYPIGSLSLPESKDLLLIDDEELIRSLLEQAWRARVPPKTPRELEDYDWVSKACSLQ